MTRCLKLTFALALICCGFASVLFAQTFEITYQGKLTDNGNPANGAYDLTFTLYDAPTGGTQIGPLNTRDDVPVTNGIFTVTLNFGSSPFQSGQGQYLELGVRPGSATGIYTPLMPRQTITSSPYSISTIQAQRSAAADNADKLGGVNANQFVQTTDSRMNDPRTPTPGSADYIQNKATNVSPQTSTNFNIDGSGKMGGSLRTDSMTVGAGAPGAGSSGRLSADIVQSNNGFIIETTTMLRSTAGNTSVFLGRNAGVSNTASSNSFVGFGAGQSSTGGSNSFFGTDAGKVATSIDNAFFGNESGVLNTSGASNTFVGRRAGGVNTTGSNNSFVGRDAGQLSDTGSNNSFFGANAGIGNSSGSNNTFIGSLSGPTFGDLQNATAIGANAHVGQSNSLVLGNAVNVGIGTTTPLDKLHVNGGSIRVTAGGIFIANPNTVIITSPNGLCWGITVNNSGGLATFPVSPCP
jgi:hypothetical protein